MGCEVNNFEREGGMLFKPSMLFVMTRMHLSEKHNTFATEFRQRSPLLWISFFLLFISASARAQEIDILLKNGRVIDPGNNIDAILDVAIAHGKIMKVGPNIASDKAKKLSTLPDCMYVRA